MQGRESWTISFFSVQYRQHLLTNENSVLVLSSKILPFNLVPIGSPALLIKTQALSSNLTTLPSGLCNFFAVLTTTACRISPLRTLFAAEVDTLPPGPDSGPKFRCFCTTTTILSPNIPSKCHSGDVARINEPIFACLFIFRTFAHSTTAAPELSMQLSIVYRQSQIRVNQTSELSGITFSWIILSTPYKSPSLTLKCKDPIQISRPMHAGCSIALSNA